MGTKLNPGNFDCYTKAEDDEPMFILLARDPTAPRLIREWVAMRSSTGLTTSDKIEEALKCAYDMEDWRFEREQAKLRDFGYHVVVCSCGKVGIRDKNAGERHMAHNPDTRNLTNTVHVWNGRAWLNEHEYKDPAPMFQGITSFESEAKDPSVTFTEDEQEDQQENADGPEEVKKTEHYERESEKVPVFFTQVTFTDSEGKTTLIRVEKGVTYAS